MTRVRDQYRGKISVLLEAGPLAVFFAVFILAGDIEIGGRVYPPILLAMAMLMVATVIAILITRALYGRLPRLPLVGSAGIMIFGGLALWLNDEVYVKLQPTVYHGLFSIALLTGLAFGRPLLKDLLQETVAITDLGWRKLSWRWSFYFGGMALLNEAVWRNSSTETWVWFKTFATTPITVVFALCMVPVMNAHLAKGDDEATG